MLRRICMVLVRWLRWERDDLLLTTVSSRSSSCRIMRFLELSRVAVVMDNLPNKVGVRDQLLEQIEVYYSGVKPEPKSIYICGYDCSYSIAWIEFSEREGADSPMSRFVRDFNYKRFLGNVFTVSVVERVMLSAVMLTTTSLFQNLGTLQDPVRQRGPRLSC